MAVGIPGARVIIHIDIQPFIQGGIGEKSYPRDHGSQAPVLVTIDIGKDEVVEGALAAQGWGEQPIKDLRIVDDGM